MSVRPRTLRAIVLIVCASTPAWPLLAARADPLVSLEAILAHAESHAPALRLARAREGLGEAELEAASPLLRDNPKIELGAGPRFGAAGIGGLEAETSIAQPIGLFGQRGLRRALARSRRTLARKELERAHWELHRQVHELYHQALLAHARIVASRRVTAFATRVVAITERQLQAGEVSMVELRLARGELARARQAQMVAEDTSARTRLQLAGLVGWPLEAPPRIEGGLDEARLPPPLAELLERVAPRSPVLSVAAMKTEAARRQLTLADRERWPDPTLGLGYAHERGPAEARGIHTAQLTLGVDLPLWNGNRAERARARAGLSLAEARQEVIWQRLQTEITDAHAAVEAAARQIRAFARSVLPAFEGNLELLQRAFELGEIDLLEVVVARGRFLELELEALAAYESYFASVARLEAGLGAEIWSEEEHTP